MTVRGAAARLAPMAALVLVLAGLAACGGPPPSSRAVAVSGDIRLPPGEAAVRGKVYVSFYQAWSLQGELRHPLQLIETVEAGPGAFNHVLQYPQDGGEGLVVYAWADLDGDGVLCTPSYRLDPAGLTVVPEFPADRVSVTIALGENCRGPDWFFPRPTPPG
jgi:hypothetical protein